jgi:hypothetical protein
MPIAVAVDAPGKPPAYQGVYALWLATAAIVTPIFINGSGGFIPAITASSDVIAINYALNARYVNELVDT